MPIASPPHFDDQGAQSQVVALADGSASASITPVRIALFTDTLGDVNGVSRFIQNMADRARTLPKGRALHVLTSTRFKTPDWPNVHNLKPIYARPMPNYEQLELAIPSTAALFRAAVALRPDVIHISTPGPVGTAGRRIARRLGVPILGTYHTDFPAYIGHLFDDQALTWICTQTMRWFYRPFERVFTRSEDYAASLVDLGIARDRIVKLLPGIDVKLFDATRTSPEIWQRTGVPGGSVKVLYVGRVSVEKNLPLLTSVWPAVRQAAQAAGVDARLVVIGDGPYLKTMKESLDALGAHFLGFKHGTELATLYASADLFAFPSTTDTLGQVVMEAQASGLPVLVSDRGGPKEVVRQGVTGEVLPAEDTSAWRRAMTNLIIDHARRERMGLAAAAYVKPMSIEHSFDQFIDVHAQAAARHCR
jgi:glycosyltransferase involved in cell wall biosynthesis